MARGKYANASEARHAREDALQRAAAAEKKAADMARQIDELNNQVRQLEIERDTAVTAVITQLRAKLDAEQERGQKDRDAIRQAEVVMIDAYQGLVRNYVQLGMSTNAAVDRAEALMPGLLVKGEWLRSGEIAVWWDTAKLKVDRVSKRKPSATRGDQLVAQLAADKWSAADMRQGQVGE